MIASRVFFVFSVFCNSALGAESPGPTAAPAPASAPVAQSTAPAPTLGRLFFTPAQRAALDEARRRPPAAARLEARPLPPAPGYVTLNGVVRRSDGTTTIWLNNRTLDGRRTAEGLEVSQSKRAPGPGNVTVRVPQAGRTVDMRVGQQLEVTSGKVQESYQIAPRAEAPAAGTPAAGTETPSSTSKPAPRRPAREREMLRELLREIDGPPADRTESPPANKG